MGGHRGRRAIEDMEGWCHGGYVQVIIRPYRGAKVQASVLLPRPKQARSRDSWACRSAGRKFSGVRELVDIPGQGRPLR